MLNLLLDQVKQAIFNNPTTPHTPGNDPGGLIGQIEGLFGQHQAQYGGSANNPLPASQDPYGDPADQFPQGGGGGNYGYAAGAQQGYPNVRPASEDPYGDPADR